MKKFISLILTVVVTSSLLAGCRQDTSSATLKPLVVGVNGGSDTEEIVEFTRPILAKQGIELQLRLFNDYVLPNDALASGEIDANLFQHVPYLNKFLANHQGDPSYDLVAVGDILVAPIGFYSKTIKKLAAIPEGGTVVVSSNLPDHGRAGKLLYEAGLIAVKANIDWAKFTFADITKNYKHLNFILNIEPALMPQVYAHNEADAVMINGTYVKIAGLNPLQDAIALESAANNPYVNVVVTKKDRANDASIQALVAALRSPTTKDFILTKYHGTVVPAY